MWLISELPRWLMYQNISLCAIMFHVKTNKTFFKKTQAHLKEGNLVFCHFCFMSCDDKDHHPNVTSILLLKPLLYPLIQKSLHQSMPNPISDLKTSSVTQYFPGDTPSSHPPHTTTGFNAPGSAERMWQESNRLFLLFKSATPGFTCADTQTCFASQDLPSEVKVGWLDCFYW